MIRLTVGTTNEAKVGFFRELLRGTDIEVVSAAGLTDGDPEETGRDPLENAMIKAKFYGRFAENVVCADSGLYIADLPDDDPRQPGLHVRTPYGPRLDDEQMIAYYAGLVHGLGGRARAFYLDAAVLRIGERYASFVPERAELLKTAFTLRDVPDGRRHPGWPIDSLAFDFRGRPFTDPARALDAQQDWAYGPRLRAFLLAQFGIAEQM